MISEIFNSILFGELRPWAKDFSDDRFYSTLFRKLPAGTPSDIPTLESIIITLLSGNKSLAALPDNHLRNHTELLTESIYEFNTPSYFNNATRFYNQLIAAESFRYINNLFAAMSECNTETDSRFTVTTAMNHLRYISVNASLELNHRQINFFPEYKPFQSTDSQTTSSRITHYAIFFLKQSAIKLIFEVQQLFGNHLRNIESIDEFYINTLRETPPLPNTFRLTLNYFNIQALKICDPNLDNSHAAISLLAEIKQYFLNYNQIPNDALIAIENYIFCLSFSIKVRYLKSAKLANFANSAKIFDSAKEVISSEINTKTYGHQRFDVVTNAIEKLNFFPEISLPGHLNTAPRLLSTWLNSQSEVYKVNLPNSFAIPTIEEKQPKKKPKSIIAKDRASINEIKSQAQEFLKHFSGFNLQKNKIMSDSDFNRLLEYTFYLIEHDKLPPNIVSIPKIGLPAAHIRYTYYLMHKSFFDTKEIKSNWIDFLQKVFYQFRNQEWQTIKTKFSSKPSKYDNDISQMLSE